MDILELKNTISKIKGPESAAIGLSPFPTVTPPSQDGQVVTFQPLGQMPQGGWQSGKWEGPGHWDSVGWGCGLNEVALEVCLASGAHTAPLTAAPRPGNREQMPVGAGHRQTDFHPGPG